MWKTRGRKKEEGEEQGECRRRNEEVEEFIGNKNLGWGD